MRNTESPTLDRGDLAKEMQIVPVNTKARALAVPTSVAAIALVLAACGGSSDSAESRGAADASPTNGFIGIRVINNSTATLTGLSSFTVEEPDPTDYRGVGGWSNLGAPGDIRVDDQPVGAVSAPAGSTLEFTAPVVLGTNGAVQRGAVFAVFDVEGGGTVTLTGITSPEAITMADCVTDSSAVKCGPADVVFDIEGGWGFASYQFTIN